MSVFKGVSPHHMTDRELKPPNPSTRGEWGGFGRQQGERGSLRARVGGASARTIAILTYDLSFTARSPMSRKRSSNGLEPGSSSTSTFTVAIEPESELLIYEHAERHGERHDVSGGCA